jgi:diadenosine tetraphosphatase ApaH/serine/threonine PP2A family protein phosphatase
MLTYAIGDIHGCFLKLRRLLGYCAIHCGSCTPRFIFIGDYVDRGPNSAEVVRFLMEEQARVPDRMTCLRGNHEAMLIDAVGGGDELLWLLNGGLATLESYRVETAAELPAEHVSWFKSLPFAISDAKRFFVHAGVEPGTPLNEQPEDAMLWIRRPFLSDLRDHGKYVVHGHTPAEDGRPEIRPNRLNIDTGAFYGGPLTAAVFDETSIGPLAFITDDGEITEAPALDPREKPGDG